MIISRQIFVGLRRVLDERFMPNAFVSENRAVYQTVTRHTAGKKTKNYLPHSQKFIGGVTY
jgi:hypothetical protein